MRNTNINKDMAELGAGSLPLGDPAAFNYQEQELNERLKRLYPAVNEEETPLPRSWSPKDKYSYIGLSQNNLRVHYKGQRAPVSRHRSQSVTTAVHTAQICHCVVAEGDRVHAQTNKHTHCMRICRLYVLWYCVFV